MEEILDQHRFFHFLYFHLKMDASMLRFFLTGSTALEVKVTKPDTHGEWLTDKVWGDIVGLSEMPQFGDKLLNDFKDNPAEWDQIYEKGSLN